VRLIPDCRDMSRILSEVRDGRRLGLRARAHLLICDVCQRLRFQLVLMGLTVRKAPPYGPGLSIETKERMRRALENL
jgi:hypothetical protein